MSNASSGYPVTPSNAGWLKTKFRDLNRKIDEANRGIRAARLSGPSVRYGTVTSLGSGGSKVQLDGAPTSVIAESLTAWGYTWPSVGDYVAVMEDTDGGYLILGRASLQVPITTNQPTWGNYDNTYAQPLAFKSPEGIVALTGLTAASGTGTPLNKGTLIGTLPPGYAPDYDLLISVNNTDGAGRIVIRANGNIEVYSLASAGYVSLSGIVFPAAGVASWKIIGTTSGYAWGGTWTNYTESGYSFGPMRMWTSPLSGITFVNGVGAGGATTSLNTMFSFPAGPATPTFNQIMQTVTSTNLYSGWRAQVNNTVVFETGTNVCVPVNGFWVSQPGSDPVVRTPSAVNTGAGWVDYDAVTYGSVLTRKYQGIDYLLGLVKSGPLGTSSHRYQPRNNWAQGGPDATSTNAILIRMQAASGFGRLDITTQGFVVPRQGSASWMSYGGVAFVPA